MKGGVIDMCGTPFPLTIRMELPDSCWECPFSEFGHKDGEPAALCRATRNLNGHGVYEFNSLTPTCMEERAYFCPLGVRVETLEERDSFLEELWAEFAKIPCEEIGGKTVLTESWRMFECGTDREDIYRWFNERHSKGVHYLICRNGGVAT